MNTDFADSVYLLDVLVVVVHISHRNCWSTFYCTRIEVSVLRAGRGRGGGGERKQIFYFKNVPGVLKHMHTFFFPGGGGGGLGRPRPPPGGHTGSENDTLLPMTMTCDRLKFWSGPAWRSKVIIWKPWRRKNKQNKKYKK